MVVEYTKTSPYVNTPQRDLFIEYLDIYTNRPVVTDDSDEFIVIGPRFHQRPDLLSTELYSTPQLWWVFVVRNPNLMIDPIFDLKSGLEIFVPTRKRMLTSILGS